MSENALPKSKLSVLITCSVENFGTILNIINAQKTPKKHITGIFSKPRYCAIAAETKGPREKPNVPVAIKIPMFFATFEVENLGTRPSACG